MNPLFYLHVSSICRYIGQFSLAGTPVLTGEYWSTYAESGVLILKVLEYHAGSTGVLMRKVLEYHAESTGVLMLKVLEYHAGSTGVLMRKVLEYCRKYYSTFAGNTAFLFIL